MIINDKINNNQFELRSWGPTCGGVMIWWCVIVSPCHTANTELALTALVISRSQPSSQLRGVLFRCVRISMKVWPLWALSGVGDNNMLRVPPCQLERDSNRLINMFILFSSNSHQPSWLLGMWRELANGDKGSLTAQWVTRGALIYHLYILLYLWFTQALSRPKHVVFNFNSLPTPSIYSLLTPSQGDRYGRNGR